MGFSLQTNVMSLIAQRHVMHHTRDVGYAFERLSSGHRINRAADDSAGLQISENLRAQIRGSQQAFQNIQEGISLLNVAEGAYSEIQENLQTIRAKAIQAFNDTLSIEDKSLAALEINELKNTIDTIAEHASYGSIRLLNQDNERASLYIQVGSNTDPTADRVNIAINSVLSDANLEGGGTGSNRGLIPVSTIGFLFIRSASYVLVSHQDRELDYLDVIDQTIAVVSERRTTIGALTNQLESMAKQRLIDVENYTAAESRIRDVDVGAAVVDSTRSRILQAASASILAQANQTPSIALFLFQGL